MSKGTRGALCIMMGLILVLMGLGGVETSLDNQSLFESVAVALLGIVLMALGTGWVNQCTDETLGR